MGSEIIDMLLHIQRAAEPPPDIASEEMQCLALQAVKLPTTLSRSQIEQLGLAVLLHMRRQRGGAS